MRRFISLLGVFAALFFLAPSVQAQNPSSSQAGASRSEAPYLLPQTIFVGDPGRLVVPLGQAFLGLNPFVIDPFVLDPFVLETFGMLNESPDLVIRKIELERRGGSSRLLIDFIPYAPGLLSLPTLDFYSLAPNLAGAEKEEVKIPSLTGLRVQVASILNPSQMTLSDPAPPLAAPGTSFLIYGFFILVLAVLFLGIGLSLWGRRHFSELWERFRRRRLVRLMAKFLRRLRQESNFEKDGNAGFYLSILSGEFREFLSLFTGVNCYSFSAEEFLEISLGYEENTVSPMLNAAFLCGLFRSWDTLRFSGRLVEMSDLLHALSETDRFITALDKAEREKPLPKTIVHPHAALGSASAGATVGASAAADKSATVGASATAGTGAAAVTSAAATIREEF